MSTDNFLALLNDNDWLSRLPPQASEELRSIGKTRSFPKHHKIYAKGEVTDALYGVLSGEIRISTSTYSGDEIILTRILPGQWFGEISLLDGGGRTHDAYTICDAKLLVIPAKALLDLCSRVPEVYQALVQLLCAHCRMAFDAMDELLAFSPEQRLARRLLQRVNDTGSLKIAISQQEMGALVGISRQSTNKILKSWEKNDWIERVYKGLIIVNKVALEETFQNSSI